MGGGGEFNRRPAPFWVVCNTKVMTLKGMLMSLKGRCINFYEEGRGLLLYHILLNNNFLILH